MINLNKIKKYLKNNFISVFTYTFSTLIIILETVNNGNILTVGSGTREEKVASKEICKNVKKNRFITKTSTA